MTPITTFNPTQICQGFRALSDPLRLQIIELLRSQELCVCELCDRLNIAQSKLSFHLKTLKEADLVTARQEGRWMYYSLQGKTFAILEAYVADYQNCNSVLPAQYAIEPPHLLVLLHRSNRYSTTRF